MDFKQFVYVIGLSLAFGYIGCTMNNVNCPVCPVCATESYHYIKHKPYDGISRVFPIYLDQMFTEVERSLIESGLRKWNEALNGYMTLEVVSRRHEITQDVIDSARDNGRYLIAKVGARDSRVSDDGKTTTLGVAYVENGVVYLISENIDEGEFEQVLMHEIGHILGAEHSGYGLMAAIHKRMTFICIDQRVMEEVGRKWGFDWRNTNYCIRS